MAKKSSTSPTKRTLDYYRDKGWTIDVAERWVPGTDPRTKKFTPYGKRKDLFGFADLVAYDADTVYLIQATSTGNMNARVKKILEHPDSRDFVLGPNRKIIVIGWKKYARAEAGKFWRPTVREIQEVDYAVLDGS